MRKLHARHLALKRRSQQLGRQHNARSIRHDEIAAIEQFEKRGVVQRKLGHLRIRRVNRAAARLCQTNAGFDRLLHIDIVDPKPTDGNSLHVGYPHSF